MQLQTYFQSTIPLRAFDIGCAVGRSSFELTGKFKEVVGLDYSQAFVDVCVELKNKGQVPYFIQEEGDLVTHLTAKVPETLVILEMFSFCTAF